MPKHYIIIDPASFLMNYMPAIHYEEHDNENKDPVKKKPGRPKTKTEETKTINIAVPVSVLEKIDIAKVCYGNNLTCYINRLIKKDIEANYEEYKNIINSLNNIK